MPRKTVFIKASGDQYLNPKFREWLKPFTENSFVCISPGAGTQTNEEFIRRGWPVKPHGPLGRETETFEQRQVSRDIAEGNQATLQDWLADEGIFAVVEKPFLEIGTVLCPVNGDQMVENAYIGYDELYVITTPDRLDEKIKAFEHLPKVTVLAFPEKKSTDQNTPE